ncbi:helix-turn-helix transcriptional regulator [Jeotgalibacillus proteolyticus]|uniref:helix-turn-helix transcriptional regulator n=1 Tax=Jeotgalibacillus proteolyticus TaxID=2082395 RepID=UPI003CE9D50E
MTKQELIELIASKLKLIRIEADFTHDRMAQVIGVSKKTLVQIEQGRLLPSWSTVIIICALFREQDSLINAIGGDALELADHLAREELSASKEKTLGVKILWKIVRKNENLILQKNIVSKHFRIVDEDHFRLFSSFNEQEAKERFMELVKQKKRSHTM